MNPEQRRRAGLDVAARIKEMRTTPTAIAKAAGIDPKTLRNLIDGSTWPTNRNQARIEEVLRWRRGELSARAASLSTPNLLLKLSDSELAAELFRRIRAREDREARLRRSDR